MCGDRDGRDASRQRLRFCAMFAAGASVLLGGVYLYAWNPAGSSMYPPCPFHALTGLHCPGCGTLRALHQLMHGNLKAALFLNPLAVLLLPAIAYTLLSGAWKTVGGKPFPTVFIPAFWIWLLLAMILAYWVLRNIPLYPFSLFAAG